MPAKSRVRKSATPAVTALVAPDPVIHELTNITVEEVSIVDRAANERTFLLRKKAEEDAAKADAPEIVTLVVAVKADAPVSAAPVLEIEDAEPIDMEVAIKAAQELKDKDAAAALAAKAAPVAPVIDPAQALTDLVAATKADITVSTPSGDVTVTVADEPVVVPPAPAALIDKVKAATLAGIDAIAARVAKFRADVEAGDVSVYSSSGTSDVLWSHVYYIKGMLEALYDIGGPSWEIESAGDSVTKAGHKAINSARVTKMQGIHKAMSYCMKDLGALVKEVSADETDAPDGGTDAAKAAPIVAKAVTTPVAVVTPVAKQEIAPEVMAQLTAFAAQIKGLTATVAAQATDLAKARNTIPGSNAPTGDEMLATTMPNRDIFVWPADVAADPAKKRSLFR